MKKTKLMILLISLSLVIFINPIYAGKLDDFEKDATKEVPKEEPKKSSSESDSDDDDDELIDFFGELILNIFYYSGVASMDKMSSSAEYMAPRETGQPILPIARLDISYQDVGSDVYAFDNRLEVGYGPFGFDYRHTHYEESDPKTDLDMIQSHFLYRMSFSQYVELGLGFGKLTLDGKDSNSGFSFSLPLHIQFSETWGFHARPNWAWVNGNNISDYDLGVLYTIGYGSIRAGYRWLDSGNVALNGPHIGLSLHY